MTAAVPAHRPLLALARPSTWSWGWLPVLSLTAVCGLLLVAAANRAGQAGEWWAEPAFYLGLLLLVLPSGMRLVLPGADGRERMSLVALLALGLFLCKVVHDPLGFDGYDEFLHWRTAQDILATGTLFTPNTLLHVSPYYPGLELVTTALANVTGLQVFDAGMIAIAASRLVFLLSLFFFFAMVSSSTRVAGIACLVYMTNPHFLYFDAQFAYETLALPLAALVLYLLARRAHSGPARWAGLTLIAIVSLASVVVTHHVSSAMLAGFLVLWAVTGFVLRRRDRAHPGRMAVLLVTMIATWTLIVATVTIDYLGSAVTTTLSELVRLIAGDLSARSFFTAPTGVAAPLWERLVGSGSAVVLLVLLPVGLYVVWTRYRSNPAVVALAIATLAYPATLAARLSPAAAQVSSRTPEFLYIAIGLVVALALARLSFTGRRAIVQGAAVAVVMAVLLIGGVIVGLPGWGRLAGPYLVSADGRSVESQGIAAAEWTRDVLGPDNVMVADRVNSFLMATFGGQEMITTYETRLPVRRLFLGREGPVAREIVAEGRIQYLVIDRRLSSGPPTIGYYFDRGERRLLGDASRALDPQLLGQWDGQGDVSRVFDSGDIQLYDVTAFGRPTTTE
jgi:hypothetical protein